MRKNYDEKEGYFHELITTSMVELKAALPVSEYPTYGDVLDLALDKHFHDVVAMRKWGSITKDELRSFLHALTDKADEVPPPTIFYNINHRDLLIIGLGIAILYIYLF